MILQAPANTHPNMPFPETRPTGLFWRTRNGRRVPIAEMSDDHLANVIVMLRRQRDHWTQKALDTLAHDGDLAWQDSGLCDAQAGRKAFKIMVLEAEMVRRHPDYLTDLRMRGQELVEPTAFEAYAVGAM